MNPVLLRLLLALLGEMIKLLVRYWASLTPEQQEQVKRDLRNVPEDVLIGDQEKG